MDLSHFQPLVGQFFDVPGEEEGEVFVQLRLCEVEKFGAGHAGRAEPFSLFFEGPSSLALDQGSYLLSNQTLGEEPIFLVPISDNGTVRQYQAIFN